MSTNIVTVESSNVNFAGRHSMDSPEWYTPAPFVEAARLVMGGIDLDPASHEEANQTVQAAKYFTEEDNGLAMAWAGYDRVFLNPPGGLVGDFWKKLLSEYTFGYVNQAVWIGYSLEQLQTLQCIDAFKTPLDFTFCVTNRRISFVENKAKEAERIAKVRAENVKRVARGEKPKSEKKGGPSHGNYVTYMGSYKDAFADVFSQFGQVVIR